MAKSPNTADPAMGDSWRCPGLRLRYRVRTSRSGSTAGSPSSRPSPELALEPDEHPAARPFKEALVDDGIPFTSFAVADVQSEFERLSNLGVTFTRPPTAMGPVTTAVFDDTCGNLIQIATEQESE
jgi:catechol 2,3-dioxygenase-like lactoylglutathione lyase family enzyme